MPLDVDGVRAKLPGRLVLWREIAESTMIDARGHAAGTLVVAEALWATGIVGPAMLAASGLLASAWSDDSARRKRVYQLTPRGQQVLARRREEWQRRAGVRSLAPPKRLQRASPFPRRLPQALTL